MVRAREIRLPILIGSVLTFLFPASPARADVNDFPSEIAFTLNWASLSTDLEAEGFGFDVDLDEFTRLDDANGVAVELRYSRPLFGIHQLRIGSAIGVTWYREDGVETGRISIEGDEELLLITPELQLSWRQPLGDRWFIEGGAGLGAVIAHYQVDDISVSGVDVDDVDEWAVGFGLRPFLRAGYAWDRFILGAEVSYRWTDIKFDDDDFDIDGELEEFMIGGFVAVGF